MDEFSMTSSMFQLASGQKFENHGKHSASVSNESKSASESKSNSAAAFKEMLQEMEEEDLKRLMGTSTELDERERTTINTMQQMLKEKWPLESRKAVLEELLKTHPQSVG